MAIHVDLGEIAMHMTNQNENCPEWLRGFESISQVIEKYPKRLNMIDTVPSYESYNWMETFSEEQGTCSFGPPGRPSEKEAISEVQRQIVRFSRPNISRLVRIRNESFGGHGSKVVGR